MREAPDIVEKLPPHRLVEAELMTKIRQPLRRHAVFARPDLDRIARDEPDRREGQEHQREESRDGERDASKEVGDHARSETNGPRLASWLAEPGTALLDVHAFERDRSKRALLIAGHIRAHGLEHDGMREEKLRRLVVLDLLHARIEFRPIGLVCQRAGFLEQLIELGDAPFGRVAIAGFASGATSQEEEIVRVAVIPGPTILA